MIAKRLAIPFIIWIAYVLIQIFAYDVYGIGQWVIPPVIILTALYVFSPQIDWWWYNRYPPKLDEKLKRYLQKISPFYVALSSENKEKFEQRIFFYLEGNDFSGMNMDGVPEDIKASIAVHPVSMTFNQENFMLAPFERIVLYKHPFPSPNMKFLHASETNEEDGVILFSVEQLLQSQLRPDLFINLGYYEYAHVYRFVSKKPIPDIPESPWQIVEKLLHIDKEAISNFTGFENPNLWSSFTAAFFGKPDIFMNEYPALFGELVDYYEINPLEFMV